MNRHLIGLATTLRRQISQRLAARGYALDSSSTQVLPNLPLEGLGMSALAARLCLTLQRTGQLVKRLEEDGYVERVPDEHDGRAKRVVYSKRGRQLVADIDEIENEITEALAAGIGKRRFARFVSDLAALDEAVNGVDAPVLLDRRG